MKRAMPAVVLTLILSSGCSDSPVAPSTISDDGARSRVAPFRNYLDSIPDRTERQSCVDDPSVTLGPRPKGVFAVLPDDCHHRPDFRGPKRFDR